MGKILIITIILMFVNCSNGPSVFRVTNNTDYIINNVSIRNNEIFTDIEPGVSTDYEQSAGLDDGDKVSFVINELDLELNFELLDQTNLEYNIYLVEDKEKNGKFMMIQNPEGYMKAGKSY